MNRSSLLSGRFATDTRGALAFLVTLAVAATGCNLYYGVDDGPQPPIFIDEPPFPIPSCVDGAPPILDAIAVGEPTPLLLGPTVQAATPPPPITGGTMALSPDGATLVASDPDRDQVYLLSLSSFSVVGTIVLQPGDEPGRVVVDDANRAHVALRSGGAVVTIDIPTRALTARRSVCAAPRGLDMDRQANRLYVACHGGELVALDPGTGAVASETRLDHGLQDVVVNGSHVYVTVFRTAELLVLDRSTQELVKRMSPPELELPGVDPFSGMFETFRFVPGVAWRTVAAPAGGGVVMLHQRARKGPVHPIFGGYGGKGECDGGIVHAVVTPMHPDLPTPVGAIRGSLPLVVDVALLPSTPPGVAPRAVLVVAGNPQGSVDGFPINPAAIQVGVDEIAGPDMCSLGSPYDTATPGSAVATVTNATGTVFMQTRDPAMILAFENGSLTPTRGTQVAQESRADTGHLIFHRNSGMGIACASCHPAAGTDAQVWEFACVGPRRTQSFQHGLLGTEPLHWSGDMGTLDQLMSDVFVGRMGGSFLDQGQVTAVGNWLDAMRPPPRSPVRDALAAARGRDLFISASVGCAGCHSGAKLTNNVTVDVGTGGKFQVPSLIGLVDRAPYMHTGCAQTLRDRFEPSCGGGDKHGSTAKLTSQQIDDLVAYLETL